MFPATLIFLAVLAQQPIGDVQTTDATVTGSVTLTNGAATVRSGSEISAGDHNARILLRRGGLLQVCSQSAITITSSASGKENLIALNKGSVEAHYELGPQSDAIITPDFRIQLPGPGAFHVAVSSTPRGDTCVQSLPGDTASVIVNEQMGEGTHQVRPGEAILFRGGMVTGGEKPLNDCGCALPKETLTASAPPASRQGDPLAFPEEQSRQAAEAAATGKPLPQQPSSFPPAANQPQMQVEAPMVFRGDTPPGPRADATTSADKTKSVPIPAAPPQARVIAAAPAPAPVQAAESKPQKKNIFQRLGSAIAGLFHHKKTPASSS